MNKGIYNELFSRNLGIITEKDQKLLNKSRLAVFGLGGLGGVICEILTRTGINSIKIIDKDIYDISNLNRQIYATTKSLGKYKTDETEERLKEINLGIKIEKYMVIDAHNCNQILRDVSCAILALDETIPCIIISRECVKLNIPLIEGWALPFGNVRVFTKETPSLEEVYELPTLNKNISLLTEHEKKELNLLMLMQLRKINEIDNYFTDNAMERIIHGEIPSFAPMVWLTACIMSFEVIKVILKKPEISYSPKLSIFNPFNFTTI